ncbi:hypothetical protein [Notoacmeibacter sp. MSK16QG-6]|uniref:hypothetical protein n=1 Tax=Notoacmeibacter sp. MSK16QG-6 TaxID=2957982 RepID=UPI00209DF2FD|nr:hypothetical protein [Notoacmeibacter sp. MSK16QG-6]MCP1201090.1 hypothetical protein [Notoacmeibacter sp. MSK16QG-6]
MPNALPLVAAAAIGIAAGSLTTYVVMVQPSADLTSTQDTDLHAVVEADPSLCQAASLIIPTAEEAQIAVNEALRKSPLAYNADAKPDATIALGQCGEDANGPGVTCMTSIRYTPQQTEPKNRLVGFAKNGEGNWAAILY